MCTKSTTSQTNSPRHGCNQPLHLLENLPGHIYFKEMRNGQLSPDASPCTLWASSFHISAHEPHSQPLSISTELGVDTDGERLVCTAVLHGLIPWPVWMSSQRRHTSYCYPTLMLVRGWHRQGFTQVAFWLIDSDSVSQMEGNELASCYWAQTLEMKPSNCYCMYCHDF